MDPGGDVAALVMIGDFLLEVQVVLLFKFPKIVALKQVHKSWGSLIISVSCSIV